MIWILFFATAALLTILTAFLLWAGDWSAVPGERTGEIHRIENEAQAVESDAAIKGIKVMTWNLGYGYGIGSHEPAERRSRQHYLQTLRGMASILEEQRPEIVLLQEIDFDSRRTHRIDQSAFLQKEAGYAYSAPVLNWRANYVPYPFFNFPAHFGRIRSGQSILSLYPIKSNKVILFSKPKENPSWYNAFYLFRCAQITEIELPGIGAAPVINIHLEAFSKETRDEQVRMVFDLTDRLNAERMILAGDFNLSCDELTAIRESAETGKGNMSRTEGKRHLYENRPRLPTYPSDNPQEMLDHIFAGPAWRIEKVQTINPAGILSDHLPLLANLKLVENK